MYGLWLKQKDELMVKSLLDEKVYDERVIIAVNKIGVRGEEKLDEMQKAQ